MTEEQMFEISFDRPPDFFKLPFNVQWEIDKRLGILDWFGDNLTKAEKKRFLEHYDD